MIRFARHWRRRMSVATAGVMACTVALAGAGAGVRAEPVVCQAVQWPAAVAVDDLDVEVKPLGSGWERLDFLNGLGVKNADGRAEALVRLPHEYESERDYPVLYLLHGHSGSSNDWKQKGAIDEIVGDREMLVVLVDGGHHGWYTDWYGVSQLPQPAVNSANAWETFHLGELMPWVESHYPVTGGRKGRFLAGTSMGGFGAVSYAARHPDRFAAVGSFSGLLNTTAAHPVAPVGITAQVTSSPPQPCIWGDPVTEEVRWRGDDPTELAPNFVGGPWLFATAGNGTPSDEELQGSERNAIPGRAGNEAAVFPQNATFRQALAVAGHPGPAGKFPRPGTHDWFYWRTHLSEFLEAMPRQADPVPDRFSFRSVDDDFSLWDWAFTVNRNSEGFTYLEDVHRDGFLARGSGMLSVITPRQYRMNVDYAVTAGSTTQIVRPERGGRLRFSVALPGPDVRQVIFGEQGRLASPGLSVRIQPLG